jgi:hypothetical protein
MSTPHPTLDLLDRAIKDRQDYLDRSAEELSRRTIELDRLRADRSAAVDELDSYLADRAALVKMTEEVAR